MKLEDAPKCRRQVGVGRIPADGFSQSPKGAEHVRQTLLQHGQEEFQATFEVEIQSAFRTANLSGNLSRGYPSQAPGMHKLLGCLQYLASTVDLPRTLRTRGHMP